MKNLKSILGAGILAGSLVLGGCGDNSKDVSQEKRRSLYSMKSNYYAVKAGY